MPPIGSTPRSPPPRRAWLRALVRACLVAGAAALPALAQTQKATAPPAFPGELRFAAAVPGGIAGAAGRLQLGPQVLSNDERAYISALPEIRVGMSLPHSPPYETLSPDGTVGGLNPELLWALGNAFGLRLKPVLVPSWSEALQAARERRIDLLMTIGVNSERLEYLAFTLGATPRPSALFTRPGTNPDLEKAHFALERDYLAVSWVRRQYPNARVTEHRTTLEALQAVARGDADAYLGSFLEAAAVLAQTPVPGIEVNRMLNHGTGYYHFAVRKDWAPLVAILNKGIHTLRDSVGDEMLALGSLPPGGLLSKPLAVQGAEAALLAARPVWRVGAVRGLALLNEVDERGLHSGIAAEYSDQVARRLGVAVQMRAFDSVAQMLDGLRLGEIDVVPFLTRTPEREREFVFSEPYVEMPYTLVARRDAPHWWNLSSLRGKRLALAPQHPLMPLLRREFPDIQVVDAPSGNGAMDMVIEGTADAAVEVKLFANLRVNGPDSERLRILAEVPELPAQFHFAALRSEGTLVALVDRALADIAPAERQQMFRRWVAVDLAPPFPWRRYGPAMVVGGGALLLVFGLTLWWARRLKAEVTARRRSEQLLTDIAGTMPGVAFRYVVDADGSMRHHYFSPSAEAFLGVALNERRTVLATLAPWLHPDDLDQAARAQARSLASGEPFKVTARFKPAGCDERWLLCEALPQASRQGRTVWTGYLVDVTAEKLLQKQLAEEAESRRLMLASASHELRAPTHTLSLALQALPRAGLGDEQTKALQVAEDSAHTLADLLNDVLDAARSGREPLKLRPRVFDLHQLLGDLARAWRSAAHTKGLRFELEIGPEVPHTVQLDPLRLKQVLINLLSNACKYTERGVVSLTASMAAPQRLLLEVADTGVGIGPAEQALLFQPFVTLHGEDKPVPEGSSGLGLATCRRVAELMGAELRLQSQTGRGTRVQLWLPLVQPQPPAAGAEPGAAAAGVATAAATGTGTGTVVVCDDDDTSRVLLTQMLRLKGYHTHDTGSSALALQRWREGGVRALVSDLDLPGMSGIELIRSLRSEERLGAGGSRTVVIVCSGSPVPAADGGMAQDLYDAYLVKPVQVSTLTDTLRRLGVVAAGPA
jgi:two-component system, NarL family, sensor histidine kinase EvgS